MANAVQTLVLQQMEKGHAPTEDLFRANLLYAKFGNTLKYVPAKGIWYYHNEKKWDPHANDQITALALEVSEQIERELGEIHPNDPREEKFIRDFSNKLLASFRNLGPIYSAFKTLQGSKKVRVTPDDFSPDSILGLKNGELIQFDRINQEINILKNTPDFLVDKELGVAYEDTATSETWDCFIDQVTGKCEEKKYYLKRLAGMILIGDTSLEVFHLIKGDGGSGKSTFVVLLYEIMGEFATSLPFSSLENSGHNGIPNDIARIQGARLIIASESKPVSVLNAQLVKQMTTPEPMMARYLRHEWFEFTVKGLFLASVNTMPRIDDPTMGIYRRLRVVQFNESFLDKPDYDLLDKLRAEKAGIFNWMIEGAFDYMESGLEPTVEMNLFNSRLQIQMDSVVAFIDENVVTSPGVSISAKELYHQYKWYCRYYEIPVQSNRRFGSVMSAKFPSQRIKSSTYKYIGLDYIGPDRTNEYP